MLISKYFIEFIIYSFIGWVWECFYCTFKEHRWENRGFLYGPVVPIYGVGAVAVTILFTHVPFLNELRLSLYGSAATADRSLGKGISELLNNQGTFPWFSLLLIFIICALGSVVLEYGTSYYLEKKFHARWWDYQDMPLNINGRVCLPATCLFGIAGVLVVRFLIPVSAGLETRLPALPAEAIALILMCIFAWDTALTVSSLTGFVHRLESLESTFNETMESKYQSLSETPALIREKGQSIAENLGQFRRSLDVRQRYALRSIRRFTSGKANEAHKKLIKYISGVQDE